MVTMFNLAVLSKGAILLNCIIMTVFTFLLKTGFGRGCTVFLTVEVGSLKMSPDSEAVRLASVSVEGGPPPLETAQILIMFHRISNFIFRHYLTQNTAD